MKKLLFVLIFMSSIANAKISCEEAGGIEWTGLDGATRYCVSRQTMNWWSAWSWCDAVGGKMFDLTTECSKATKNQGSCSQVANSKAGNMGWTKNLANNSRPFRLSLNSFSIDAPHPKNYDTYTSALCTMPQ